MDCISTTLPEPSSDIQTTPPLPPQQEFGAFKKGNFDYITCITSRNMISTAYQAVNLLELWSFMKEDIGPYMYTTDPRVYQIYDKVSNISNIGHSGFSFSWTLRQIQSIAQIGEEEYMKKYLST
jgi:hypothetical protein